MPEWLEYASFARFLVVASLFVGPITECWERRWPDKHRSRANRLPDLGRGASGRGPASSQSRDPGLINDLLADRFPVLIDWSACGKFLVGRIRSRRDAKPGRGSIAWLALHLGTMGYPQFVVSAPEPAYSLSLSLSRLSSIWMTLLFSRHQKRGC